MAKVYARIKSGTPWDYIKGDTFEVLGDYGSSFHCDLKGAGDIYLCLWEGCAHLGGGSWERITEEEIKLEEKPMIKTEDNYKTWGEMTPEEKGALLLARLEGKTIQSKRLDADGGFSDLVAPAFDSETLCYRVKPETVKVTLYGDVGDHFWSTGRYKFNTHKITFDLIDGEPDCDSIRMERLEE